MKKETKLKINNNIKKKCCCIKKNNKLSNLKNYKKKQKGREKLEFYNEMQNRSNCVNAYSKLPVNLNNKD